jgi:hypothetical protein
MTPVRIHSIPGRRLLFRGKQPLRSLPAKPRAALLAGLLAFCPLFAASGQAQTRQEEGRKLVDQALAALGGEKFLSVRSMVQNGRAYAFYRQDVRGLAKMTIFHKYEPMKPDAEPGWLPISRRMVFTEKGDYYELFRNGKGWEVTFRGARPLEEERLHRYREATQRDFFYFLRYRLNEPGLYFYHKGFEIIDNVPTEAVDITDAESETITVYIRRSDNLPVQQVYTRRDPKTRIPYVEKSVFSKYRNVDGVMVPWNLRNERDGDKIFEMFGASAEINKALGPEVFELDKKLPILPPNP